MSGDSGSDSVVLGTIDVPDIACESEQRVGQKAMEFKGGDDFEFTLIRIKTVGFNTLSLEERAIVKSGVWKITRHSAADLAPRVLHP